MGERTAEEFIQQLAGVDDDGWDNGRWFVGEFRGRKPERYMLTTGRIATVLEIQRGAITTLYKRKSSAKRAAQRWLERTLDRFAREEVPPCAAAMGCLCAGHARGADASEPCDTTE
jgi:hypothetical protein